VLGETISQGSIKGSQSFNIVCSDDDEA